MLTMGPLHRHSSQERARVRQEAACRADLLALRLSLALSPRTGGALNRPEVQALLDEGADPSRTVHHPGEELPRPPALFALIAARQDTETALAVARLLLDHGVDVAWRDGAGRQALHLAAEQGWSRKGIAVLVAAGARPNAPDRDGRTPLHRLMETPNASRQIWENRGDWVAHLVAGWVSAGADVNARTDSGETPLELALKRPARVEGVLALLEHGARWSQRAEQRLCQWPALMADPIARRVRAIETAKSLDGEVPQSSRPSSSYRL